MTLLLQIMPKSDSFWDHPIATIEKALDMRKQIEAMQSSLSELLSGAKERLTIKSTDGRKGKRSPAARAKMAAAQKARWAKRNSNPTPTSESVIKRSKKKRKMSSEGRARIVAALKARWAKKRGASTPAAPAKSTAKKRKTMSWITYAHGRLPSIFKVRK